MNNFARLIGIVIYSAIYSVNYCVGNISIDHRYSKKVNGMTFFNKTQKYWGAYISKVTEIVTRSGFLLRSNDQKVINLLNILQHLPGKTKIFCRTAIHTNLAPTGIISNRIEIMKPLGKLRKHSAVTEGYVFMMDYSKKWNEFKSGVYYNNRFTWSFNGVIVFGLKCNFKKIYFSSYTSTECQWGKLNLKRHSVEEDKHFVYCGQYSDMINYSNSAKLDIIIVARGITFYDVSFSFMLVDSGLGRNYPVAKYSQKDSPVLNILFPSVNMKIYRFYVSSIKINKLILQFLDYLENDIVIHDGPGFECNILKPFANNKTEPSKMLFFTSSFQCMVHTLQRGQTSLGTSLTYTNMKQGNKTKIHLNFNETKFIPFPNSIMNDGIGIFDIIVPSGFYVNISILNFNYHGFRISTCRFAGITAYNRIHNSYKEISTVCKPHHNIYKTRKMYSETSKITLVFYQYKEYSKIEVEILLSVIRCAPLQFDLLPHHRRYRHCSFDFLHENTMCDFCTDRFQSLIISANNC